MIFRTVYKGYTAGVEEPKYHVEFHRQSLLKHIAGKLGEWLWDLDWSSRNVTTVEDLTEEEAFRIAPYWKKIKERDEENERRVGSAPSPGTDTVP